MDENAPPTKKVKKPLVYGVSQKKWYDDNVPKNAVEALRSAGSPGTFAEQEKVFDQNRPALTKNIRLHRICKFFISISLHFSGIAKR